MYSIGHFQTAGIAVKKIDVNDSIHENQALVEQWVKLWTECKFALDGQTNEK